MLVRYLAVILSLLLAPIQGARPADRSISAAGKNELSQFLLSAVDRGDVPGVVALVVDRDKVLYRGAAGKLDLAHHVEMPADALFRIASMTKPITSVAALMLVESGKLRLDDPVSRYLPEFANRPVIMSFDYSEGTYTTRPSKREITIRHLLSHTSGIGYSFSNSIVERLLRASQKTETELPLLHDPGDRWTYGAGTRVLGWVVEKLSGQELDSFFLDHIFRPLKMFDTTYVVPSEKLPRVVTVHRRSNGQLVEQANTASQEAPARGDGGLYSTASDYATFLQMLLNGGKLGSTRLLSERSVRIMGENQIGSIFVEEQSAANPALTRPFPLGAGRDKFGLGYQIAMPDERYTNYRSPGSLSWAGIYNTHFWIDQRQNIAAVVLIQVLPFYDDACIRTLRGFEAFVYRHLR